MNQKLKPYSITIFFIVILAFLVNESVIAKPLIITNSATFPPFSFLNDEGKPQGLFIDLWNEWAKKNNHEIKFLLVDWNESLELVRKGEADIHAGLFQSEIRKSFMDFSGELFQLTTGLFISTNLNVQSIDELKKIEIGVTKGGFEEEYLRSKFTYLRLRLFDNNKQLVKSAISGELAAFVADYPVGMYYLHRHEAPEKFRILKILYSNPLYSAVKKGDKKLLALVNSGLQQINKDAKERILQKWIRSEQILPSWVIPFLVIAGVAIILCGLLFYVYILQRNKIHLTLLVEQRTTELREKNAVLEKAFAEVKTLRGIIPICSFCKKIRNDKGYWDQVDVYVQRHTLANFSHSLCPECAKKHYPEFLEDQNTRKFSYEIKQDQNLVLSRCRGVSSLEDIIKYCDEIYSDPLFIKGMNDIVDLSHAYVNIDYDQVKQFSEYLKNRENDRGECRIAFVTNDEPVFALVNTLKLLSEDSSIDIAPFKSYQEAIAWVTAS